MSEEKNPYLGVQRQTVQGTPVSNEFTKRWLDKIDHWDGTMPETAEEELERLRQENMVLQGIVEQVARLESVIFPDDHDGYDYHEVTELVEQARAALGEHN